MEGEQAAANSLKGGMEETLTLHNLGMDKALCQSLRTTNIMENINCNLKERLARIRRWVNSDQLAALHKALLEQIPKAKHIPVDDP